MSIPPPGHDRETGLLTALWRFRWMVVGFALACGLIGYGASLLLPTEYEARAELILTDPTAVSAFQDVAAGRDLSRYVRNEAAYLTSSEVLSRAAESLDGIPLSRLRNSVTATAATDVDLITISARAPTASRATETAEAVAMAYQDLKRESVRTRAESTISELSVTRDRIQAEIDELESALAEDSDNSALQAQRDAAVSQLVTLDSRIAQIDINSALFDSGVANYEPPAVPQSPSSPRPLRNAAAALILGGLTGGTLAWWRADRFPLARMRYDPAPILGAPLLGEMPEVRSARRKRGLPAWVDPSSPSAEPYQFIVSALDFALADTGGATVLVTSPGEADGKTVTTIGIAAAARMDGRTILIVDADERRRQITRLAGQERRTGLLDLTRGSTSAQEAVGHWSIGDQTDVQLVAAGTDGSTALFRVSAFGKVMRELRAEADLVLVDSPPVLAVPEVADIAAEVDGVVLVVRQRTPIAALHDVRARLELSDTPILGYVFNRVITGRFGYSSYPSYYQSGHRRGSAFK